MGRLINYNSWDEKFKAPFGALNIKDEMTINVLTNKNYDIYNIYLVTKCNSVYLIKTWQP